MDNDTASIPTAAAIFNNVPALILADHSANASPTESKTSVTDLPASFIAPKKLVDSLTVDFNVSKLPFIVLNIPPANRVLSAPNIAPKSIEPNALPIPSSIGAIPFPRPCKPLPKTSNTLLKSNLPR